MAKKELHVQPLYRELTLALTDEMGAGNTIDEEARTVEMSFASDYPVRREFGDEILRVDDEAMDASRAGSMPLLVNHDRDDIVGVVEKVWTSNGVARALVRFGQSSRASEVFQDVIDGIRNTVSFGYRVFEMVRTENTDEVAYEITRWQPFEITFATIPADPTVGVGRSSEDDDNTCIVHERELESVEETDQPESTETREEPVQEETKMTDKTAAQLERERIAAIREAAKQAAPHISGIEELADDYVNSERSLADFNAEIVSRMDKIQAQVIERAQDMNPVKDLDAKRYSIVRAINAQLTGNWDGAEYEREVSDEIARASGKDPNGIYVPLNALSRAGITQANFTSGATGAGAIGTETAGFIEDLYNKSVLGAAGATFLPNLVGNLSIPKITGGTSFNWVDEAGNTAASQIKIGAVTLSPKTIMGKVVVSRKMLQQSTPAIENIVRNDMLNGIAGELDKAAFVGYGTNQPTGLRWNSDVSANGVTGSSMVTDTLAANNWTKVVELETDVAAANADFGSMAYITNSKVRGAGKTVIRDSSGAGGFLVNGNEMNGYPVYVTNAIPSTFAASGAVGTNTGGAGSPLFFGAWDQLLIGMWGAVDITADPYSQGDAGALVLRVFMDCDVAPRHGDAFAYQANIST